MLKLCSAIWVACLFLTLPAFAARTIPEVSAKATHAPKKKSVTQTMQTSSLSATDLNNAPPVNLSTVLTQEQSIVRLTNNSGDNSQSALSIRGFGDNASANSLILIDGFPLTNATTLSPTINALTLGDIQLIDIYQGSQGTLWGDQAVGGVVNITTRSPNKFIGNMNASAGSFNQQYVSALLGNKLKNGVSLKGFILTDESNNYREHNEQHLHSGLGQIGYDYSLGSLNVYLRDYTTTTQLPGGLTQAQYDANPRQATNFTNYARYHTTIAQVLSKHALNDNWLLETRLANQAINGDGRVAIPFQRNEWQIYFNPRLIGHVNQHKIIVGYAGELSHFHMNNRMVDNTVNDTEQDVYAELTTPLTSKLNLILGGREAWQKSQIEKQINPTTQSTDSLFVSEQGLTYHLDEHWQFYLRRDGNFRFAKANEQTWLPAGTNSLEPQTGVSYETGTTWLLENQQIQLSLYRLLLQNEIAFNPAQTATEPFGAYQNYQQTKRDGVTLTDIYKLTTRITLNGQLNYINARFTSGVYNGNQIPAVPSVNGNLGLTYDLNDHWQGKYFAIYTGDRFASEDTSNTGNRLPSYWLQNVAVQYKYAAILTSFEMDNMFNQIYSGYTLYDTSTKQNTYYPGAGRSYVLTLKASFE